MITVHPDQIIVDIIFLKSVKCKTLNVEYTFEIVIVNFFIEFYYFEHETAV